MWDLRVRSGEGGSCRSTSSTSRRRKGRWGGADVWNHAMELSREHSEVSRGILRSG